MVYILRKIILISLIGTLLLWAGCKQGNDPGSTPVSFKVKHIEWYVEDPNNVNIDTFTFSFRLENTANTPVFTTPTLTKPKITLPYTMTDVWGTQAAVTDMNATYWLTFAVKDKFFDATSQEAFMGSAFAPENGETETTLDLEASTMRAKLTFEWGY